MKVIDLEAHFSTQDYKEYLLSRKEIPRAEIKENIFRVWYSDDFWVDRIIKPDDTLLDLGELRLREMDALGIDMQALSLGTPHVQCFEAAEGTLWAKKVNNELAAAVNKHPDRFIGLACVAPQSPEEAADELERAVSVLGLKGLCLHSHARNEYLDDKKYWGIFERAEKLEVPIYLHPGMPPTSILKPYVDYGTAFLHYAFDAELALHVLRLIHSGLFDKYPKLQMIIGHMGEGLPFWLSRLDIAWRAKEKKPAVETNFTFIQKPGIEKKTSEYLKTNFTITTSGVFFQPALICACLAVGVDKIAFAVDYPMVDTQDALQFMKEAPICDSDKEKIYHLNAERLFKL